MIEGRRVQIERRLRAVLFSAFAAESYVNEFLGAHFAAADFDAVDRMNPINKYVIGTRFGAGEDIFLRDRPPIPTLKRLFKLRDRLVHPKPGFGPTLALGPLGDFDAQFTGRNIADFVVATAAAGLVLVKRTYGPDHLDIWTDLVWFGKDIVFKLGEDSEHLPSVDSERSATLVSALIEARSKPSSA